MLFLCVSVFVGRVSPACVLGFDGQYSSLVLPVFLMKVNFKKKRKTKKEYTSICP